MVIGDDESGAVYSCESITKLSAVEAVREVPSMYIGDVTNEAALGYLVEIAVTRGVDGYLAGRGSRVDVVLHSDGQWEVRTDADALSLGSDESTPGVTTFSQFPATFRGDRLAGPFTFGLGFAHELVLNALSESLSVEFSRRGRRWCLAFARGQLLSATATEDAGPPAETTIVFRPDPVIFTGLTRCSAVDLRRWLREVSFLVPSLTLSLRDDATGTTDAFHSHGGVRDFIRQIDCGDWPLVFEPTMLCGELQSPGGPSMKLDIAMRWGTSTDTSVISLVNGVRTHRGGTHVEPLRAAVADCLSAYAVEAGLSCPDEDGLTPAELTGLSAVLSLWHTDPILDWHRARLASAEVGPFVEAVVKRQLFTWLRAHPNEARAILDHVLCRDES